MKKDSIHSMEEDEVNLLELLSFVLLKKRQILKFIIVFFLIGVFLAIFSPKEYMAKTVVVAQTSKGGGRGLSGFAALAGFNIGANDAEFVSTAIYPKIAHSIPFKIDLVKTKITLPSSNKKITFEEYFLEHQKFNLLKFIKSYTIGLPSKLLKLFKADKSENSLQVQEGENIFRLTKDEVFLFNEIDSRLTLDNNIKEGYLSLSFSMPEPIQAAEMTKKFQELLEKYVIEFKIQKVKDNFMFIKAGYDDAKKEFMKKQAVLARFNDRNQRLITNRSQSRLRQLETEYNLAYSVYSELAKKLEAQKIKLKEDAPLFSVIQPVSVPVDKSKPKRGMILFIWTFLGVVLGIMFIFINHWLKEIKNKI